jgi:DNA-binding NarL/FixJ family response regulator
MAVEALPRLEVLETVGDGCQTLKLVANRHPDLVLLDLDLSWINGLQSLALIHEYYPRTRVIILAGEESVEVRATCLAQGADGFICKHRLHPELRQEIAAAFSDRAVGTHQEMD